MRQAQILHTSIGGTTTRVEISNAFGQQPLVVSDVHIAKAHANGQYLLSLSRPYVSPAAVAGTPTLHVVSLAVH